MIYIYIIHIYIWYSMIFYEFLWISMIIYDYVVILWYIYKLWICMDCDMYGYVMTCAQMCVYVHIYINHVWFDWIWLNDVFPCHNLIVDVQLCITPEHVLRSPCILYSRPMDDPGVWRVYMAPCPLHRGPHWQPLVDPPSYLGIVEPCRTIC
jgi:hypothetical protein